LKALKALSPELQLSAFLDRECLGQRDIGIEGLGSEKLVFLIANGSGSCYVPDKCGAPAQIRMRDAARCFSSAVQFTTTNGGAGVSIPVVNRGCAS
jgi:hypothetical protein